MTSPRVRTLGELVNGIYQRPGLNWLNKRRPAKTGKSGGSKLDRWEKRKRKIAEASRRRNRRA